MATATKKAPAKGKKTEAKAEEKEQSETAKKAEEAAAKREARQERDAELTVQILKMREDEVSWADIATELEISPGKAMFLEMCATVKPKDRITGSEEDVAEAIVKARDEDLQSWGRIAARTGLGESKCRSLYKEASGKEWLGNRIGKGGRYPGDENPNPDGAPKAPKGEKATKRSATKAEDANPSKKHIADMNKDELDTRMSGKTMTVRRDGKNVQIKVTGVKKLAKNGDIDYVDGKTGNVRTVNVKDIVRVSR